MKKFLLLAAVAVAMTGSAFAQGDGAPAPVVFCAQCPDQTTESAAITAEADVAVPLKNYVVDNNICFGCLLRNQTVTVDASKNDNGSTRSGAHSFASGTTNDIGNVALVEFAGDASDWVNITVPNAGALKLSWVPGPSSQVVAPGVGNNDTTMALNLNAWSYNDVSGVTHPSLLAPIARQLGPGPDQWAAQNIMGVAASNPNGMGVGEIDFYIGGTITSSISQQRGHYKGSFTVKAAYQN